MNLETGIKTVVKKQATFEKQGKYSIMINHKTIMNDMNYQE